MITKIFLKTRKLGLLPRCLMLLLLAACITGCSSPGAMLQESAIKQVKEGMTRQEVLRIMGAPKKTVTGPGLGRLDNYRVIFDMPTFSNRPSPAGDFTLRSLQVFYDDSGKVDFVESFESTIPYWQLLDGIPRGGIRGGVEAIPKIEKSITNLYDLTAKIGEPMLVSRTLEGDTFYSWFVYEGKRSNNLLEVKAELSVVLDDNRYIVDYRIFGPKE